MCKNVLVIGNGFDRDLGLPTKYSDFINSVESDFLHRWKEVSENLATHLLRCSKFNWFDIEEAMVEYVKRKGNNIDEIIVDIDKCILKELKKNFWEYVSNKLFDIGSNSWRRHIKSSLAKQLIELQNKTNYFDNIYSFNCMDGIEYELASNTELECISGLINIHGKGHDFILGIADGDCNNDRYDFLKKSNQEGYSSEDIEHFKSNLLKANTNVIFGHSLNRIDMGYFRDMFMNVYLNPNPSKGIIIITKAISDAQQIKENISNYVHIPFDDLSNSCQLTFLYTDNFNSSYKINDVEDLFKSCEL